MVFIGIAGGDVKCVKGRMYALDAKTGKIVWELLGAERPERSGLWRNRVFAKPPLPKDW
jgi:outer membrane protein assembly factor BamB